MYFKNNPTVGDWVTFCDMCGTPCKASGGAWKSAGINDNSLWLCKKTCYNKFEVNPMYKYPAPSIRDKISPPFTRAGFDSEITISDDNQNPVI